MRVVILICQCLVLLASPIQIAQASTSQNSALEGIPQDADVVEIVDYKRNLIIGYMIFRNAKLIKKITLKEPITFSASATTPATSGSSNTSTQSLDTQDSAQLQTPTIDSATDSTQESQESQESPTSTAQSTSSQYEKQLSSTPSDKEKINKTKSQPTKKISPKNLIETDSIDQIQGMESSKINNTYKNRQWDKKKIPYEMQTRTIDTDK